MSIRYFFLRQSSHRIYNVKKKTNFTIKVKSIIKIKTKNRDKKMESKAHNHKNKIKINRLFSSLLLHLEIENTWCDTYYILIQIKLINSEHLGKKNIKQNKQKQIISLNI